MRFDQVTVAVGNLNCYTEAEHRKIYEALRIKARLAGSHSIIGTMQCPNQLRIILLPGVLSLSAESWASIIYNLIDIGLDEGHRILLAKAVVGMGKSVSRHWVEIYSYSDPPPPPSKDEAAQMARHLADLVWAGLRAVHAD
ncbi:MAG: hypothetical protein ACYDGY_06520 [Acidimicrobiales bacterium]